LWIGSDPVVVAHPTTRSIVLTPGGQSLISHVDLEVEEIISGEAPERLVLRLLGGTMTFGDGARAEVRALPEIAAGRRQVIFLRRFRPEDVPFVLPGDAGAFEVPAGSQGAFDIIGPSVLSHASGAQPLYRAHHGQDSDAFVAAVRSARARSR
jgi:hypothetical protein